MSTEAATLGVTLNRDRLNQALAGESFASDGEFVVDLHNEGAPVHVHLRFTGPLADVATVETSNHYVDAGATLPVPVSVGPIDESVEGTLRVVTGHGAEGTEVAVTVDPPPAPVDVDESLGSPKRAAVADEEADGEAEADGSGSGDRIENLLGQLPPPGTLAVAAVAVVALVGAGVVAATLNSVVVTLGSIAVLVAVAVALFLLTR
ncbi:DUF7524 family protein [Halobaculum marinum]|uniref:Uncharacterized protein n=1 Tax=Halobaculum marinum TaxID=3031996 RepID=A0ABD5WVQ5_9EURY|nr:hypothetical protein [Halobaculum sp. DT55]